MLWGAQEGRNYGRCVSKVKAMMSMSNRRLEGGLQFRNSTHGLERGVHVASVPQVDKSNRQRELRETNILITCSMMPGREKKCTHCLCERGIVHVYSKRMHVNTFTCTQNYRYRPSRN